MPAHVLCESKMPWCEQCNVCHVVTTGKLSERLILHIAWLSDASASGMNQMLVAYRGASNCSTTCRGVVCWSCDCWRQYIGWGLLRVGVAVLWVQACSSRDGLAAAWDVWVGLAGSLTAVTTCVPVWCSSMTWTCMRKNAEHSHCCSRLAEIWLTRVMVQGSDRAAHQLY
jgi:hypothetical protein